VFFVAEDVAPPSVLLVRPGGEVTFVRDAASGGPLHAQDEPRIAITSDGTMHLFHGDGCVRALARDGRVLTSNTAALRADRDAATRVP
jgi:hypothetical protein